MDIITQEQYNRKVEEFAESSEEYNDLMYGAERALRDCEWVDNTNDSLNILMLSDNDPSWRIYQQTHIDTSYSQLIKKMAHNVMVHDIVDVIIDE